MRRAAALFGVGCARLATLAFAPPPPKKGGGAGTKTNYRQRFTPARQVVVEPRCHDVVFPGRTIGDRTVLDITINPVEPHNADVFGMGFVVGDEHSALADSNGLVGGQAEAGDVALTADHAPGAAGRNGVGGVLHHPHAARAAHVQDGRHVGRLSGKMHDHHGLRVDSH